MRGKMWSQSQCLVSHFFGMLISRVHCYRSGIILWKSWFTLRMTWNSYDFFAIGDEMCWHSLVIGLLYQTMLVWRQYCDSNKSKISLEPLKTLNFSEALRWYPLMVQYAIIVLTIYQCYNLRILSHSFMRRRYPIPEAFRVSTTYFNNAESKSLNL